MAGLDLFSHLYVNWFQRKKMQIGQNEELLLYYLFKIIILECSGPFVYNVNHIMIQTKIITPISYYQHTIQLTDQK